MNQEKMVALFIGGGKTPIEKIAPNALNILKERQTGYERASDKLNILWSGIDVATLLTMNGLSVITGGYREGYLGMANDAAFAISRKSDTFPKPAGVVFPDRYPNDPLQVRGDLITAHNTAERLAIFNDKSRAFFLMGGGGLGTAEEIFFTLKEEAGYDEVRILQGNTQELGLQPRPILVVDPTEKVQALLQFYFEDIVDPERRHGDQIMEALFQRIYLFGQESFRTLGNSNYPGLLRLKESSKQEMLAILSHYTGEGKVLPSTLNLLQYLS